MMSEVLDNITLLKATRQLYVADLFYGDVDYVQEKILYWIIEEKSVRLSELVEYLTPNIRKKFEFEIDASKFDLL